MAKFVPDVKTNRWVIITPSRISRPHDNTPFAQQDKNAPACPFCPGEEGLNKELFRVVSPPAGGWQIRVITNKYPITDYHEVIIHSPDHAKDIDELPLSQVELILKTYRQRYNFHLSSDHDGHIMIFNNHDVHAGASIAHPHSQLVVVPRQINLDTIQKEPIQNEVVRTNYFVAYCPDFSQWPYEIWVAPTADIRTDSDCLTFGSISDAQISDLAPLLQKILRFIIARFSQTGSLKQKVLPDAETGEIPYNYYIYHGQDWYLRIIPRLIHRAGFELGTGLSVNIVDPAQAAQEYKMNF